MNWNNFKSGQRCRKCSQSKRHWTKNGIKKVIKNNNNYTYFGHRKEDRRVYVTVICENNHRTEVRLDSIQRGQGCFKCSVDSSKKNYEEVVKVVSTLGYELLTRDYRNNRQLLKLRCEEHGSFRKSLVSLNKGVGCPKCYQNKFKRESECNGILERLLNVKFVKKRHDFLKMDDTKLNLELDGYNAELNLAFEYNGEQHYKSIPYFGGDEKFKRRKLLDDFKRSKCVEYNVKLIEIPYCEKDLELFITNELTKLGFDDRIKVNKGSKGFNGKKRHITKESTSKRSKVGGNTKTKK